MVLGVDLSLASDITQERYTRATFDSPSNSISSSQKGLSILQEFVLPKEILSELALQLLGPQM